MEINSNGCFPGRWDFFTSTDGFTEGECCQCFIPFCTDGLCIEVVKNAEKVIAIQRGTYFSFSGRFFGYMNRR